MTGALLMLALAASPADPAVEAVQTLLNDLGLARPTAPPEAPPARIASATQDWAQPTRDLSCHTLTPLVIGTRRFEKGIGAHANGRIVIELAQPAARFSALVGVDNNTDTDGRRGSVEFVLAVDGAERMRTPVCRCGEEPRAVAVDLTGARLLELILTDAGDGISFDQADWAEARLTLADGTTIDLGDLLPGAAEWPFAGTPMTTFDYDGEPVWPLLQQCPSEVERSPGAISQTWALPPDGVALTLEARLIDVPPAIEVGWRLRNRGGRPSGIVGGLRSIDLRAPSAEGRMTLLSCSGGLIGGFDQRPERLGFELSRTPLGRRELGVVGGRSSDGDLPFFQLRDGATGWGVAVGLGWSGRWRAEAAFDDGLARLTAGMDPVHFRLEPGQDVRLPSALLVPFRGPDEEGCNRLRRVLRRHYQAQLGGRPVAPPVSFNSWFVFGNGVDAAMLTELAAQAAPLGIEYFCLDAGWFDGDFPAGVGNWTIAAAKFPDGLKPVADAVHALGMRFGLWFEPERVAAGTRWASEHADLLVGDLLDLGRPEAQELVLGMLDETISAAGVDWIRYDFNTEPLRAWRAAEDGEHQGLRQILHQNGLERVLDEVMRRHPDLLIEQCSSGGRRIDLRTIARGHTIWKSDDTANQSLMRFHQTGANVFLPGGLLNTNLLRIGSPGEMLALFAGPLGFGCDFRALDQAQRDDVTRAIAAYRRVRDLLNEDYFPLFEQTTAPGAWSGWQFLDPVAQRGYCVVYRPAGSPYATAEPRLRGLHSEARYRIEDLWTGEALTATGAELAGGRAVSLAPDSAQAWLIEIAADDTR